MSLASVINSYRGQPMGPMAGMGQPASGAMPVGTPISTPIAPVTPQLPQIPWNHAPQAGGAFDPASYLNPYHPNPYGNQIGQFPNLYGNPHPATGQQGAIPNLETGKLPAQPRTYGA